MPFGPNCEYADFKECVRKNQDKDDPDAWCAKIQRETEGKCAGNMAEPLIQRFRDRLRRQRPVAVAQSRSWYRIEPNKAKDTTEIYIYEEIGGWFGITAQDFVNELREITTKNIDLHLNSPGGDVFDGIAIHTALVEHDATVHVRIDSLAASAASFIAMAGDRVSIAKAGTIMIHDAFGFAMGNAQDMRDMADLLDRLSDTIAGIYVDQAGGTRDSWRSAMKEETWYNADEALAAGLVDEIRGEVTEEGEKARNAWDLSLFAHQGRNDAPAPPVAPVEPSAAAAAAATDAWDFEITDDVFEVLRAGLEEVTENFEWDPDIFRTAVTERATNAPATPTVEPGVYARTADVVGLDQFAEALREALQ